MADTLEYQISVSVARSTLGKLCTDAARFNRLLCANLFTVGCQGKSSLNVCDQDSATCLQGVRGNEKPLNCTPIALQHSAWWK